MIVRTWVDGGRSPAQSPTGGPGVSDPGWQEVKVACCPTLSSTVPAADPPAPRLTAPGRARRARDALDVGDFLSSRAEGRSRGRIGAFPGAPFWGQGWFFELHFAKSDVCHRCGFLLESQRW